MEAMRDAGVEAVIECGVGNVASGLARRVHKGFTAATTDSLAALDKALAL